MPKPQRSTNAQSDAKRQFPLGQIQPGELISEMSEEEIHKLLIDRMEQIRAAYLDEWLQYREDAKRSFGVKRALFRGVVDHDHPLYNGGWADQRHFRSEDRIHAAMKAATARQDWQEVMMCAGMLCVRDMLYGRTAPAAKPAPAPKAKAVRKTAQKKPAAKKPGLFDHLRKDASAVKPKPAAPRRGTSNAEKLAALVERARPLFEKNPDITREELIEALGRGYERLTTLAKLRAMFGDIGDKPPAAAKPKRERPRRDPPPPAGSSIANLGSAQDQAAAAKVLREAQTGIAGQKTLTARFEDNGVSATFTAKDTEDGWTTGWNVGVALGDGQARLTGRKLSSNGPLDAAPNAAIRNCVADMLDDVKDLLKRAEAPLTDEDHAFVQHAAALEKLRAWLLGFQARGVEKIKFLQEQEKGGAQQLELAA